MKVFTEQEIRTSFNALGNNIPKSVYVYHLNLLKERINHLKESFPSENVLHAIAIKTNNLTRVLSFIVSSGCGLEAASFEEVKLALSVGCKPEKIVFDSPVKTSEELLHCNKNIPGLKVNANSFGELKKLESCNNLNIGIRINPMLNLDSPDIFMVSGAGSKFGIPITERENILKAIQSNTSIKGLHIHPGSEIKSLSQHIACIKVVYDLAIEVNREVQNKISWIDIGGGIKPKVDKNNTQSTIIPFLNMLKKECPTLFNDFKVITEYGRYIHTYCAYAASRVEDILTYHTPNIALIHLGADMFLREIYSSTPPKHNYYNLSRINEEKRQYDIGGPLCFSGDFISKNEKISRLDVGDYIGISDCGSNSISMWSQHCSREKPKVIYVQ